MVCRLAAGFFIPAVLHVGPPYDETKASGGTRTLWGLDPRRTRINQEGSHGSVLAFFFLVFFVRMSINYTNYGGGFCQGGYK